MVSVSVWLVRLSLFAAWCLTLLLVLHIDEQSSIQSTNQSVNQSIDPLDKQPDNQAFWATWKPDFGPFCEFDRSNNFLRERSNALSDFSFLAIGLYMIDRWIEDSWTYSPENLSNHQPPTLIHRYPVISLINGLANILHAIGTFTNHACRCHFGHRIDLTGMWIVSFFPVLMSLMRVFIQIWPDSFKLYQATTIQRFNQTINQSNEVFPTIFSALYMLMLLVYWLCSDVWYSNDQSNNQSNNQSINGSYDTIEPALIIANIVCVGVFELIYLFNGRNYNHSNYQLTNAQRYDLPLWILLISVACLGIGAVLGHIDARIKWMCDPYSSIQLHAIWHVLAAMGLFCVYQYYRNERSPIMKIKSISKEK